MSLKRMNKIFLSAIIIVIDEVLNQVSTTGCGCSEQVRLGDKLVHHTTNGTGLLPVSLVFAD
jgi:hypothetical protein